MCYRPDKPRWSHAGGAGGPGGYQERGSQAKRARWTRQEDPMQFFLMSEGQIGPQEGHTGGPYRRAIQMGHTNGPQTSGTGAKARTMSQSDSM